MLLHKTYITSCFFWSTTMFLLLFGLLWSSGQGQGAAAEHLTGEELTSWVKLKVLEGLGVEEPPEVRAVPDEERRNLGRSVSQRRAQRADHGSEGQEAMQIILFTNPSCATSVPGRPSSGPLTFHFQPSVHHRVTSAQLWFFSGVGLPLNSSGPVSMLTSGQQRLLLASAGPSRRSRDGWSTYNLNRGALESMGEGPFWLQVHCSECQCFSDAAKTPFLNLMVQNRKRKPRSASLPWSPSVVDLLQRPSQEAHGDCNRAHVQVSFEELGWDSWIVHPKTLTFYYCHGNCSSPDRAAASLGVTQCCAPVPGSMRSIRITTTSDGGYSFKYETLPNIMPEECACI
uniref:Inhibin alpha chain n=1 Tax=Neogobius melanostomus TaxID=47308 RepID=A0A8C6SI10_9GOBI